MTKRAESPIPQLAPPGAGLPWWQHYTSRYIVLPTFFAKTSWDEADRIFQKEGRLILSLARKLSSAESTKRVLVDGVWGIEDSSRYWSTAMVMEHLIIVGDKMADAIVELSHERRIDRPVSVAEVKPAGEWSAGRTIKEYDDFLTRFARRMMEDVGDKTSTTTFDHPWFGPFTTHKWICIGALHQRLHRVHAQAIIRGLPKTSAP